MDVLVKPTADAEVRAEAARAQRRAMENRMWELEWLPDRALLHLVADDRKRVDEWASWERA